MVVSKYLNNVSLNIKSNKAKHLNNENVFLFNIKTCFPWGNLSKQPLRWTRNSSSPSSNKPNPDLCGLRSSAFALTTCHSSWSSSVQRVQRSKLEHISWPQTKGGGHRVATRSSKGWCSQSRFNLLAHLPICSSERLFFSFYCARRCHKNYGVTKADDTNVIVVVGEVDKRLWHNTRLVTIKE